MTKDGMTAAQLGAASGFSAKEIANFADRGILASKGGGRKGVPRLFSDHAAQLCKTAKMLTDDLGLQPSDAFRIAHHLDHGQSTFGRFHLSIGQ